MSEKKQTAVELVNKYYNLITNGGNIDEVSLDYKKAKELAIIEIQSNINLIDELENSSEFLLSNKYMELIETKNELTKMLC